MNIRIGTATHSLPIVLSACLFCWTIFTGDDRAAAGPVAEPIAAPTWAQAPQDAKPAPPADEAVARFLVKKDGNYGYIDKTGRLAIELKYEQAKEFSEGLAAVKVSCCWGFIDTSGQMVIQPQYRDAEGFSEGLGVVSHVQLRTWLKWGYIDRTGKVAIGPRYRWAFRFSEGLAGVGFDDFAGNSGFIDKSGQKVFKRDHFEGVFSEGLLLVFETSFVKGHARNFGFVNKTGRVVVPLQYAGARSFSEGLGAVEVDGKWGFIDKAGEMIIPPQFNYADSFSEGLAAVETGTKCGFIDKTGRAIIPLEYNFVSSFSEGLAAVMADVGGEMGYMDKTGRMVIPPQFSHAEKFSEGLARVGIGPHSDQKLGYIDKTEKYVWEPTN